MNFLHPESKRASYLKYVLIRVSHCIGVHLSAYHDNAEECQYPYDVASHRKRTVAARESVSTGDAGWCVHGFDFEEEKDILLETTTFKLYIIMDVC